MTQTWFEGTVSYLPQAFPIVDCVARDAVRDLRWRLRVPRAWVYGNKLGRGPASEMPLSQAKRLRGARLLALEEHAEQAGTRALARRDWIAAAELEEERVVRQHELAQLLSDWSCTIEDLAG